MNRKKIGLAVLALALCIGLASAVLLDYYGRVQTTLNVSQSVLLDGEDWTTPILETLNVSGGYYYGAIHYLDNQANIPVNMKFTLNPHIKEINVSYLTLAHLTAIGESAGTEARVVITMPAGFTLGDIETVSWFVYTTFGYPPHVDIILAEDIDGNLTNIDSLTAELAENDNPENLEWNVLQQNYEYRKWLRTFEYDVGVGDAIIDNATMLWVTRLGSGCDNAPYGTLDELKAGTIHYPTGTFPPITLSMDTLVDRLEIEVDNWIEDAEAYIGYVEVNGILCEELPIIVEGEIFALSPNERLYFGIRYFIDPTVVGTQTITTKVVPA